MKEPWTAYVPCCCCCKPKRDQRPPKPDLERGDSSTDESVNGISPAERAIDIALRHSTSSRDIPDVPEGQEVTQPPPSYDSVLKDDDIRTPRRRSGPAELRGSAVRAPPPAPADNKDQHQQQESVFSDDEDVVLTPPTTAPPTILDEDSEDERINGTFRGR